MSYRLGIDFGGTTIKTAVIDEDFHILGRYVVPTGLPASGEELVQRTAQACRKQLEELGLSLKDVRSAGVGMPGTVNQLTGAVEYANNLGMTNFSFIPKLRDALGIPVTGGNDADCAALGEYLAGAGQGATSLLLVTLGTGIGGAILVKGQIWRGCNDAAAEFGHMVIEAGGRPCTCGRRGCFEAYASATALVTRAKEKVVEAPGSELAELARQSGQVSGKEVLAALKAGDAAAKEVFKEYLYYLSLGITNLINIFQPEKLLIGGGISNFGDVLLTPVRERVEKYRYSRYSSRNTSIELASLRNDAGLIGAAALPKHGLTE